jgi:capsule polysaccharide modification protein KpsS
MKGAFKHCFLLTAAILTLTNCEKKEISRKFDLKMDHKISKIELYTDSTFTEKVNSKNYYGRWKIISLQDSIIELLTEGKGVTEIHTLTPRRTFRIEKGELRHLSQK